MPMHNHKLRDHKHISDKKITPWKDAGRKSHPAVNYIIVGVQDATELLRAGSTPEALHEMVVEVMGTRIRLWYFHSRLQGTQLIWGTSSCQKAKRSRKGPQCKAVTAIIVAQIIFPITTAPRTTSETQFSRTKTIRQPSLLTVEFTDTSIIC